MDSKNLETKIKGWFSKSAKASKEAFVKAGDKVQDFTDKSVLKIEKKQLESKLEAKYTELGKKVADLLSDSKNVTFADAENQKEVNAVEKEIKTLIKQITEKEKEIDA